MKRLGRDNAWVETVMWSVIGLLLGAVLASVWPESNGEGTSGSADEQRQEVPQPAPCSAPDGSRVEVVGPLDQGCGTCGRQDDVGHHLRHPELCSKVRQQPGVEQLDHAPPVGGVVVHLARVQHLTLGSEAQQPHVGLQIGPLLSIIPAHSASPQTEYVDRIAGEWA